MPDDIDKTIQENLNFTVELADKIIQAAGEDSHDAFIKAVGTLAQVIYIITPDEHRAQALKDAMRSLKMYLKLLDAVVGPSLPSSPPH